MKFETLTNLVFLVLWAVLGITALIGAIFFGAYWNFFTAGACLIFVIILWNDDACGKSVKSYFSKAARAKKRR